MVVDRVPSHHLRLLCLADWRRNIVSHELLRRFSSLVVEAGKLVGCRVLDELEDEFGVSSFLADTSSVL